MKKTLATLFSALSLLIAPAPAFALFNMNQGGTGQAFFTDGSLIYGNGTNPLATTTPGTNGYVLQFNGTFPTWVSTSSLGLVTPPAGSDGQVQFNNGGVFGADSAFKSDPLARELHLGQNLIMGDPITGAGDTIYFVSPVVSYPNVPYIPREPGGLGQNEILLVTLRSGRRRAEPL